MVRSDWIQRSISPPFQERHLPPVALTAPKAARGPLSPVRPRARTRCPGRSAVGSPSVAAGSCPVGMLSTARSVPVSRPFSWAGMRRPSGSVTVMFSSRWTVASVVTMTPSRQWTPLDGSRGRAWTETTDLAPRSTASASWSEKVESVAGMCVPSSTGSKERWKCGAGSGIGRSGRSALTLEQLQEGRAPLPLVRGESDRALAFVILHFGIGAVRQEITRQLQVLFVDDLVQRRPSLVLLRVDRCSRLDNETHRLGRPARDRGVDGLNAHRVARHLRDVGAARQQQAHRVRVAEERGEAEREKPVAGIGVDECRVGGEQRLEPRLIARPYDLEDLLCRLHPSPLSRT